MGLISISIECIISMILARTGILYFTKKMVDFDLWKWLGSLITPIAILSFVLLAVSYTIANSSLLPVTKFLTNFLVNAILTTFFSFFLLFYANTRSKISRFIFKNRKS